MLAGFLFLFSPLCLPGCSSDGPRATWDPDSIPDAYSRPGAALLWPGLGRAFHVDENGDLANGLWRVRFRLPDPAPLQCVAYEDRWLPIARWTQRTGDIRWAFEAVAFPARSRDDSVLAVSIQIEATNTAESEASATLAIDLEPLPPNPTFVAPEDEVPDSTVLRWTPGSGSESALACGWSDSKGGPPEFRWRLAPNRSRRARIVLTTHPCSGRDLARVSKEPHARQAARVRHYWTQLASGGTEFQLTDPEVETALRAAKLVLLACRERRDGVWNPIGGPFQYRDTWIRDGARLIQALAVAGHTEEARAAAHGIARLQWPHGPYLTQRGQLDGSGQALWAMEQALLRPRPSADLGPVAARAIRCWQWAEAQRELGRQSGFRFGTMLGFGDPRDGELVRAQLVGNDAWMIRGYRSASRICGAARMRAESTSIERSRERYVSDFESALRLTGTQDLPPSWQGVGRDWGNLAVAWPTQVLSPIDPRCERTARRVWAVSPEKFVTYGHEDSAQTYVGADLGVWAMLADHPASADSVLSALLEWRNASGAHAELFSRSRRDFGRNLPPHPTAAAALVTLVRNALVYDDADTLMLTLAARDSWWRQRSRVRGAPTRWGLLDATFERRADEARWSWTPVPVWTLLRVPPGTRVESLAPPLRPGWNSHFVLAPPGVGEATVVLASEGGP